MHKKFKRNRRGLSTVIATIIIVAIAIVMAIAVAYWAMGVGSSFTRFEKLQYTSTPYATTGTGTYIINFSMKNAGTAAATIDPASLMLDGQPASSYTGATVALNPASGAVPIGSTITGTVTVPQGGSFTSGTNVALNIQSAAGNSYPNTLTLP